MGDTVLKTIKILPTGQISIGDINTELSTTGQRSLGQSDGRALAGVTSGQISLSDYQGKVVDQPYTINFSSQVLGDRYNREANSTVYSRSNALTLRLNAGVVYIYSATPPSGTGDTQYITKIQYRVNSGSWIDIQKRQDTVPSGNHTMSANVQDVWSSSTPSLIEVRVNHYTGDRTSGNVGYARANPAQSGQTALQFTGKYAP